ncbi:unnamed protein product [Absidia cylindrospora]
MASLLWTKSQQHKSNSRAPSSIFSSNNNLSPRQVANKAYSLAIKKLDRDDKRNRPQYNVRERLLLCNTLCKAEQFLQKRTARSNRRVMAFEDDDMTSPVEDVMTTSSTSTTEVSPSASSDIRDSPMEQQYIEHHHSPLCHIEETDDEEEDDDDDQPKTPDSQQQQQQPITPLDMALAAKSLSPMGDNAFVIPQDDEDFLQHTSSFLIPNNSTVLASDCRPYGNQNSHMSPIASII